MKIDNSHLKNEFGAIAKQLAGKSKWGFASCCLPCINHPQDGSREEQIAEFCSIAELKKSEAGAAAH